MDNHRVRLWSLVILYAVPCAAQYTGSETCAKCHPAEFAWQVKSGHAKSLAPSGANQPGEWAFGAGNQAVTFVSRLNQTEYLELGKTWYRVSNGFGITPGHQNEEGLRYRVFDPSAGILKCFACHSTGPLQIAENGAIVPYEFGVRCEVCHGPGAAHAASPQKVRVRNPGVMNGMQMNAICGECHRVQSSAEDGSNLLDPWNSRHQPLLLAASLCFKKSARQLSCITCHSPHRALEVKQASYNKACLGCHSSVRHTTRISERACSECHMPAVRLDANLAFANHRIGIYAPGDALSPLSVTLPAAAVVKR